MSFPQNRQLVPGRDNWGQFMMPDGTIVNVKDESEQIVYDSDLIPAIPGTAEYILFRNPTFSTGAVKTFGVDHNMPEWGRVPKDWYYSILTLGFFAQAGVPSFDLQALVNRAYMVFRTGSQKTEADGLLMFYPFGIGIGGAVSTSNPVAAEASGLNIGTPATASVAIRAYKINLPEQTSFECRITFPAAAGAIFSAMMQIYGAIRVVRSRPVS
jgi:hypothetical protein